MKNYIKKLIVRIFKGFTLPVFSSQLKGMRLKVDPLMPGNLFWNNVEEGVHNAYNIFIKKGFTILDIGANVGLHSYYMSRHFENTKVYSFEPLPANAEYIRKAIALNKIKNITLIEKAVGEISGNCYFDTSVNNHQGHITDKNEGISVKITTLDDFLSETNLHPHFIKIDVEGGESAVLNGFKKNILLLSPIMIIEIHTSEQAKKVSNFFRSFEYTLFKMLHENKSENKPFLIIDNRADTSEPPKNLHGQIVAIPNKKCALFNSFFQ